MNLFATFDPNLFSFPIKFISIIFSISILMPNFWMSSSNLISTMISQLLKFISNELKNIIPSFQCLIFSTMFIMIANVNLFGLCPGMYAPSTHPVFALSLAFPLWFTVILNSLINQPIFSMAHLMPKGTPLALQPFMVLIEIISNIIRPITLTVRLTANLMAGHLVMVLIEEGPAHAMTFYMIILSIIPLTVIIGMLEFSVAFIQGYVFSILSTLYAKEFDSVKLNK